MSFNVKPAPATPSDIKLGNSTPSQAAAKERAIAILKGSTGVNQAQALPVPDASHISPEDSIKALSTDSVEVNNNIVKEAEATATPASEAPKPAAEPESKDPMSSQYAILARKEKALRAKAQQLEAQAKAREDAFTAREAAFKAKEAEQLQGYVSKDSLKQNLWTTLSELGYSYDDITQAVLNQQQADPRTTGEIAALKNELKAIRQLQEQNQVSVKEQEKRQYQQAVNQIKTEVKNLVNNDPAFETVKATGSVNDVVELIEKTFKEDGYIMSIEDAAKEVEEYVTEQLTSYATKIKKIQQKLNASAAPKAAAASQSPVAQDAGQKSTPAKTLTNALGSSKKLSARDRAIAAMEGRLNNK